MRSAGRLVTVVRRRCRRRWRRVPRTASRHRSAEVARPGSPLDRGRRARVRDGLAGGGPPSPTRPKRSRRVHNRPCRPSPWTPARRVRRGWRSGPCGPPGRSPRPAPTTATGRTGRQAPTAVVPARRRCPATHVHRSPGSGRHVRATPATSSHRGGHAGRRRPSVRPTDVRHDPSSDRGARPALPVPAGARPSGRQRLRRARGPGPRSEGCGRAVRPRVHRSRPAGRREPSRSSAKARGRKGPDPTNPGVRARTRGPGPGGWWFRRWVAWDDHTCWV